MPLIKSPSKAAFKKNVETEMKSNPAPSDRAKNLAIAYSVRRQARKKKMAMGGELSAATEKRPSADDRDERGLMMDKDGFEKQDNPSLDESMLAEGGEVNFHDEKRADADDASSSRDKAMMMGHKTMDGKERAFDEESMSMNSIDDAKSMRDEDMLDGKPTRHADEVNMASGRAMASDRDERELAMLRMAKGGLVDAIMAKRRKMMSDGGQVDLQDNADEQLNEEDQLSFQAPRKKTYFDDSQISEQPMDSNEKGDMLSDEDEEGKDMLSKIRSSMKRKKMI